MRLAVPCFAMLLTSCCSQDAGALMHIPVAPKSSARLPLSLPIKRTVLASCLQVEYLGQSQLKSVRQIPASSSNRDRSHSSTIGRNIVHELQPIIHCSCANRHQVSTT